MIKYNLVLPAFEATPKNVRVWDSLAPVVTKSQVFTKVYLVNELPPVVTSPGVFPAEGHVRTPDAYGPTGTEYTGTEQIPVEADVKLGVGYGENGTEFTGTLAGGGGHKRVRTIA
jgi:hypothetical protein